MGGYGGPINTGPSYIGGNFGSFNSGNSLKVHPLIIISLMILSYVLIVILVNYIIF